MVRPSVVRTGPSPGTNRREPEGIESGQDGGSGRSHYRVGSQQQQPSLSGTYDHSSEYDPYQSAARQMQVGKRLRCGFQLHL